MIYLVIVIISIICLLLSMAASAHIDRVITDTIVVDKEGVRVNSDLYTWENIRNIVIKCKSSEDYLQLELNDTNINKAKIRMSKTADLANKLEIHTKFYSKIKYKPVIYLE